MNEERLEYLEGMNADPETLPLLAETTGEIRRLQALCIEAAEELETWSLWDGQGPACGICQYDGPTAKKHDRECIIERLTRAGKGHE